MQLMNLLKYGVFCPFSAVCSCILMCSIAIVLRNNIGQRQRIHFRNIFWMAFSDFGISVTGFSVFIYPSHGTGSLDCTIRGITFFFFILSSINWYLIICLNLLFSIKKPALQKYIKYRLIIHICVWGVSSILTGVPYNHYEQWSDGHCTLNKRITSMAYWNVIITIPGLLAVLLSFVNLLFIFRALKTGYESYIRGRILSRTNVFVFVFLVTWLPTATIFVISSFIAVPEFYQHLVYLPVYFNGTSNFLVWFCHFPAIQNHFLHVWQTSNERNKIVSELVGSSAEIHNNEETLSTNTTQYRNKYLGPSVCSDEAVIYPSLHEKFEKNI